MRMIQNILDRINFIENLLPELEAIAVRYFRTGKLETANKESGSGFDPVTVADREIERTFRKALKREFPYDSVLGEEFTDTQVAQEHHWVIDPIDGTRAFVIGSPSFAILISYEFCGTNQYSVISQPFTQERFVSHKGQPQYSRGIGHTNTMAVSSVNHLSKAKLASTFPEIGTSQERLSFERVAEKVQLVRYGMDAYAYALLAMGHIDLVIEAGLKPFDFNAPRAVVISAGGVFCGWCGGEVGSSGQVVAAANQELANQAVKLLMNIDP